MTALRAALTVACVTALVALAGCTAAPPVLPAGVHVDVKQYRSDYQPRQVQVRVANDGTQTIVVRRVTLSSPFLAAPTSWSRFATTIAAGRTVDFAMPLPAGVCGDATKAAPRVRIDYTLDGRKGTATRSATQSLGDLDRVHREDCLGDEAAKIAALEADALTISGSGAGSVAQLHIAVTPGGGDGSYVLHSVAGTVLLSPVDHADTGWTIERTLSASDAPSSLVLDVVPTRCDPHVIAEDKVGTLLKVHIDLGTVSDGIFYLPLAGGIKQKLLEFVASHCGL